MDRDNVFNCCEVILQKSNDGDDLSSSDLQLVENGVNGFLSPRGEVVLFQLKYKVVEGIYHAEPIWFCGITNLTRGKGDDRSVFWREIKVEHFDHDFWCSKGWEKSMQKDSEQVAKTCQWLEAERIPVTWESYMKYCRKFSN